MKTVFITDRITNPNIEKKILGSHLSDTSNEETEVLLVWNNRVDAPLIDRMPNLKGIIRYGVGYEMLDWEYGAKKGIYVCNTPDYGTEEVSDTALAMILNILRGVTRYDYKARTFKTGWQENTLPEIRRGSVQTLGVLGAGRIGGRVLLLAKMFSLDCVFYDPYKEQGHEKLLGVRRVETMEELLEQSDILSINAPLTPETNGLIDKEFLGKMKKGASLVNTARGPIIKHLDVLYDALKSEHLASVALDVLPDEPPGDHRLIQAWKNREPWLEGRLLINPHTAFFSSQSFDEMREKAARNALRILEGKKPYNIIAEYLLHR